MTSAPPRDRPPLRDRPPPTPERAWLVLRQWRRDLVLNPREREALQPELAALDRQLDRLQRRTPRVAVFGRVGVGKSSLLNALLGEDHFATDVAHGCTRHQEMRPWSQAIAGLNGIELIDTPGIDEIAAGARQRLAARVALGADLVLLVIDSDLTRVELDALDPLLRAGKPLLLVLNRNDAWPASELPDLLASIRERLPAAARHLDPIAVAAAPRQAELLADGRVRSSPRSPRIQPLRQALIRLLERHGDLLLALNALLAADRFSQSLHRCRLRQGHRQAQTLIGRYAALKATGVVANPLMLLDLAGGLACDSFLVMQLCDLYGLPMTRSGARELALSLSGQNALLGGIQVGLQVLLGGVRQVLTLGAPFTGGLSLAPAAPVALAQAALAVHTTRRTGRLAAEQLLRGSDAAGRPGALLRRLAAQDPQTRQWLGAWAPAGANPGGAGANRTAAAVNWATGGEDWASGRANRAAAGANQDTGRANRAAAASNQAPAGANRAAGGFNRTTSGANQAPDGAAGSRTRAKLRRRRGSRQPWSFPWPWPEP